MSPIRGTYPGDVSICSVLVADDDGPIRRMLERTLAGEGFSVTSVGDGGAALAAVERLDELALVAGEIEASVDSRRRLPESASADEARRLGVTLNEMLGTLGAAYPIPPLLAAYLIFLRSDVAGE